MKLHYSFWGLVLLLMSPLCLAQIRSGQVTDENNLPLPGATVVVEGTSRGTTTDFDGNYQIEAQNGQVLVFSFVGYTDQRITIGAADRYDVQMQSDTELEEVIVVGYGTTTKESFVGTATKVDSEEIQKKNTTNISQAIAGEVAGVNVINSSGQPGSTSTIRIRGFGSIQGNRSPLIVLDGIPYSGSLNSIDKSDIESYTVLKDASATAIYGSRGANGVVLITTKKGKKGTSIIETTFNRGFNDRMLPDYQTLSSPEQYVEIGWEALKNFATINGVENPSEYASQNIFSSNGINPHYNMWDAEGNALINPQTGKFNPNIDRKYSPENWLDHLFGVGERTEASMRLSGGVDKTTYSTSFGGLEEKGFLNNSSFKRLNTRIDLGHEVKDWLKGGFNIGYAHNQSSQVSQAEDASSALWFAQSIPSIYPVFLRDTEGNKVPDEILGGYQYDFGDMGRGFGLGSNPAATSQLDINQSRDHELNGSTFLEATFLEHFTLRGQFGLQYQNSASDQRGNVYYGFSAATGGNIFKVRTNLIASTALQSLKYKNNFGLHTFEAGLYHENQRFDYYVLATLRQQLADPNSLENNNAVVNVSSASYEWEYRIESFFGSLNYDYDEKYYASIVIRRDGSSKFLNHKWGNFYSLGGAWIASKESFLSDLYWLDTFKLKISYGTTGDQEGASGATAQGIGLYSGYDLFNVNNLNDRPAFEFDTKGNPDLTWEKSKQFQIGTELSFLERLQIDVDYYIKTTDNLLVRKNVGPSLGYRSFNGNDGSLRNSGLEFSLLGSIIKTNDFKLDLSINGAVVQNTIRRMPIDPATGKPKSLDLVGIYGRSEGSSIFDHYMRVFAGVDPDTGQSTWYVNYQDKNNNNSFDSGEEIGSLTQFRAENPDTEISEGTTTVFSEATQRYTGTSAIPDIQGAFKLEGSFKGFELSAQFLYQFGGTGYDSVYRLLMGNDNPGAENYHVDILNRWQKADDQTSVPRVSAEADLNVNGTSTRFLISSDYIALNNVRLGYNFSERLSEQLSLEKLSLWVSGDNLWLQSKRDGYNPTTSETGSSGVYNYAPLSTIAFGLQLTF